MNPVEGYYTRSRCQACQRRLKGFVPIGDRDNLWDFKRKTVVAVAVVEDGKILGWVCNLPLCTETVGESGRRRFQTELA